MGIPAHESQGLQAPACLQLLRRFTSIIPRQACQNLRQGCRSDSGARCPCHSARRNHPADPDLAALITQADAHPSVQSARDSAATDLDTLRTTWDSAAAD